MIQSRKPNRRTGYRGVRKISQTGKFRSSLKYLGQKIVFGDFDTVRQAVEARNDYIRKTPGLPKKYAVQEIREEDL